LQASANVEFHGRFDTFKEARRFVLPNPKIKSAESFEPATASGFRAICFRSYQQSWWDFDERRSI
jgi:hypothetical protein